MKFKSLIILASFTCAFVFREPLHGEPGAAAPEAKPAVSLENFKLISDLSGERAQFTLTAIAHVENSKGAILDLLSGQVALTEIGAHKQWSVRAESNRYSVVFEHSG